MRFLTLTILILLFGCITNTAQSNIAALDSTHAKVPAEELKFITMQFIELDATKQQNVLLNKEIGILKRTVADKDNIIDLRNAIIDQLKQQIEDARPAWYNKFSWGFGSAAALVLVAVIFL